MSRESIISKLKRNHDQQTAEIKRLKDNVKRLTSVIGSHKAQNQELLVKNDAVNQSYTNVNEEYDKLLDTHNDQKRNYSNLENSHALIEARIERKEAEIKAVKEAIETHKDEIKHVKKMHQITKDEHAELKTMHDKLLGLFGASSKEEFEKTLNQEIAKFEGMVDDAEKETTALQKDFDTMEKDFNVSRERNETLEQILEVRDKQMEHYESMAGEMKNLQEEHSILKNEHEIVNDLHANEKKRANELEQLHGLADQERSELSALADDIVAGLENGDLTAQGRHELEDKILHHINVLKGEIDEQEKLVDDLQGDLGAEKKMVKKLEDDLDKMEKFVADREIAVKDLKYQNDRHVDDKYNLKQDIVQHKKEVEKAQKAHASELKRAEELDDALNITKKEHAALKDIHDTLLADFNAGNAEQFKKDLDKKIGDFEKLINTQEDELKLLKSQQVDEYAELNKDLQAILGQADMTEDIADLHSLNQMIEDDVLGTRLSSTSRY